VGLGSNLAQRARASALRREDAVNQWEWMGMSGKRPYCNSCVETIHRVVVHHADSLHEGVTNRKPTI
jgi:hypothetical protein